jgi:hypothetical protein
MKVDGSTGFTAEVDLLIPDHLHDLLDDMPLAHEINKIKKEWYTPYMMNKKESSAGVGKKLLLTHVSKTHYVIHFELLQFYLHMGVKISKVHRIITFTQSTFFEPYITFNSTQRQAATDNFSKDFFKLKNNSLFDKTMESVRGRKDMRLCQTEKKMRKYVSKPLFRSFKFFAPELVAVILLKEEVLLDKPYTLVRQCSIYQSWKCTSCAINNKPPML